MDPFQEAPASPPPQQRTRWNLDRRRSRTNSSGDLSAGKRSPSLWKNVISARSTPSPSPSSSKRAIKAKEHLQTGFQKLGTQLQKINLSKMIDGMERDQQLADQLEDLNERLREDKERRDIVRESERACLEAMEGHLYEFLGVEEEIEEESTTVANPFRVRSGPTNVETELTYEAWIEALHPENTHDGKLIQGLGKEIDDRFYVDESDHRRLWNSVVCESRRVAARSRQMRPGSRRYPVEDLLNDAGETGDHNNDVSASDPSSSASETAESNYDEMFGRVLSTPADKVLPPAALDDEHDNLIQFD